MGIPVDTDAPRIRQTVYDAILGRSIDKVYNICLEVLKDSDAARDAQGAVLEKYVRHTPSGAIKNLDAWLAKTARNTAIDHWRARKRLAENHPRTSFEDAFEVEDPSPTPEDISLSDDLRQNVRQYLTHLSPEQRRVVELRNHGFSSKEVAKLTGQTPNAVDQIYFRALNKLRELIERDRFQESER